MTNLSQYALHNGRVVWFFLAMMLIGGIVSFFTLGKKEDAVFVIKSASLSCSYPGATPVQVEQLITEPIEREVQSMRRVYKITSESYYGLSRMLVELDPATRAAEIPQLWDELRRKVADIQPRLPAGASAVTVADDFGDVYGIYYGLSADEGFSWSELRDWAQRLKKRLVTVDEGCRKSYCSATGARNRCLCQSCSVGRFRHPARDHRTDHRPAECTGQQRREAGGRNDGAYPRRWYLQTAGRFAESVVDFVGGQTVPVGRRGPHRAALCRASGHLDAGRRTSGRWASVSRPRPTPMYRPWGARSTECWLN